MFKAITGSDDLEAERKFHDAFLFTPFARLVFLANHFPQSKDSSQAFFRRWTVVPFNCTISPEKRIPRETLDALLSKPSELSGVLNKALQTLPFLQTHGGFTQSESLQEALQEFREQTDPLATWLDRFTESVPQAFTTKKDLLIKFNAWSQDQGRPVTTAHAFTKTFRRLRPNLKEVQRTISGSVERGFVGLRFRSPSQQSSQDHDFHNFSPFIYRGDQEKEGREKEDETKNIIGEKVVKDNEALSSELFSSPPEVDPWK